MRVATIAAVFLPCVVFSFSTSITIKFSGSVVDRWQPIKSAATHHEEVNHVAKEMTWQLAAAAAAAAAATAALVMAIYLALAMDT